jgi:hypothetical protein
MMIAIGARDKEGVGMTFRLVIHNDRSRVIQQRAELHPFLTQCNQEVRIGVRMVNEGQSLESLVEKS